MSFVKKCKKNKSKAAMVMSLPLVVFFSACQMPISKTAIAIKYRFQSGEITFNASEEDKLSGFIPSDASAVLEVLNSEGKRPEGYRIVIPSRSAGLKTVGMNEGDEWPSDYPLYFIAEKDGKYSFSFRVLGPDGAPVLGDDVSFQENREEDVPPLSLSEEQSSDDLVSILVPKFGSRSWKRIWVEGDVDQKFKNKWLTPGANSLLDIRLSAGEGLKFVTARARDGGSFVSRPVTMTTRVDSTPPGHCLVESPAPFVQKALVNLRIASDETQPIYARALGDINEAPFFHDVTNGKSFWVSLTPGDGRKKLQIFIKDAAENFCPPVDFYVVVDHNYNPMGVTIKNATNYSMNQNITLLPRLDVFDKTKYEMFIDGNVKDSENTFKWIPATESVDVTLSDGEAQKTIFVKYRDEETETDKVWTSTYYSPSARYYETQGGTLVVAQIQGANTVSVEGCGTLLSDVNLAPSYRCPGATSGSDIFVTYKFADGSSPLKIKAVNP